jgi:hypothetical protein
MNSDGRYTLSRCPLCGGQLSDSSCVDYDYAFRKNLEHIATAESDRAKQFAYLANGMNEIRSRLFGVSIGRVQEKLSVLYLKQSCPCDHFSEEMADKHGTDIVASIMEPGYWYVEDKPVYTMCIGKISISIKKQKKWHNDFLDQLEKNIQSDKTRWGLLITAAFPNEALNENVWTARTAANRLVLIVKPTFAPVAYFAIRQMVVYECELRKTVLEKTGVQNLIQYRNTDRSSKLEGDKIKQTPVGKVVFTRKGSVK